MSASSEPVLWLWTKHLTPSYSMWIGSVISLWCCSMKHHIKDHWPQNIDHKCDITFIQQFYKEEVNIEWHFQHNTAGSFCFANKMVYNVVSYRIVILDEKSDIVKRLSAQTTTLGLLNYWTRTNGFIIRPCWQRWARNCFLKPNSCYLTLSSDFFLFGSCELVSRSCLSSYLFALFLVWHSAGQQ